MIFFLLHAGIGSFLDQDALAMKRSQMGLSLFSVGTRAWNGVGSAAIRDYTVTGVASPMFPPLRFDGDAAVARGFAANSGAYAFNLAFRDELNGVLVQDIQDELDMAMLYPDQESDSTPSTCCDTFGDADTSLVLVHRDTTWRPNRIERSGHWHKYMGTNTTLTSFSIASNTSISAARSEIFLTLNITNRLMNRPLTLTIIPDHGGKARAPGKFTRDVGESTTAIALSDVRTDATTQKRTGGWTLTLAAERSAVVNIAIRFVETTEPTPSKWPTGFYDGEISARVAAAQFATAGKLRDAASAAPRVWTSAHPVDGTGSLAELSARSILSVLQCRMNVSTFALQPFYELGNGAAESVLWDLSFSSRLLSQTDPAGLAVMIKAFFRNDILNHSWINGVTGAPGSFYVYGPFCALEIVQDLVAAMGSLAPLRWASSEDLVEDFVQVPPSSRPRNINGTTILDELVRTGLAMNATYARHSDGLFDIGGGTGRALEIRESGYEYTIAEVSALGASYCADVANWAETVDAKKFAIQIGALRAVAETLAEGLATLWDPHAKWYSNEYPDGSRHTVLSVKALDMLRVGPLSAGARARGTPVVPLANKRAMAARLVRGEMLAPFGLFSIARSDDLHWDREDCDCTSRAKFPPASSSSPFLPLTRSRLRPPLRALPSQGGGGGMYVGTPGRVASTLYALARDAGTLGDDATRTFFESKGDQIIARIARWSEAFPYFPQTIYGDTLMLQPHERNWFLQLSSGAAHQAIVDGVFGVTPIFNPTAARAELLVAPSCYNASILGGEGANLTGYTWQGRRWDIMLTPPDILRSSMRETALSTCGSFEIRVDGEVRLGNAPIGKGGAACILAQGGASTCTLSISDVPSK